MWITMWINVKNLTNKPTTLRLKQVQNLFQRVSTTYPQKYGVFSQGFTVSSPHIHRSYYYY